eukprot:ANDGO_03059.mRNA.1 Peptidyl-prolyl cis-trans isomerase A
MTERTGGVCWGVFFVLIGALVSSVQGQSGQTSACKAYPALCPHHGVFTTPSPAQYSVNFSTSAGAFTVDVLRSWAPIGADRFYALVKSGFYNDARFYRVLPGFVVQFGIAASAGVSYIWENDDKFHTNLPNDPVISGISNVRGWVSYAAAGDPVTGLAVNRTTEIFVNYGDNSRLDKFGFVPFGVVKSTSQMGIVDRLYSYGEVRDICAQTVAVDSKAQHPLKFAHPSSTEAGPRYNCTGPYASMIYDDGNDYLVSDFPLMDYVISAIATP